MISSKISISGLPSRALASSRNPFESDRLPLRRLWHASRRPQWPHQTFLSSPLHSIEREDSRYKQDRHHDDKHTQAPSPIVNGSVAYEPLIGTVTMKGDGRAAPKKPWHSNSVRWPTMMLLKGSRLNLPTEVKHMPPSMPQVCLSLRRQWSQRRRRREWWRRSWDGR